MKMRHRHPSPYILDQMGNDDDYYDDYYDDYMMECGAIGPPITRDNSTPIYNDAGIEIGRIPITDWNL